MRSDQIVQALRVPLQTPDYAPYLQRAKDAKPEALFVWVPGGLAAPLLRQVARMGQCFGQQLRPNELVADDRGQAVGVAVLCR